MGSKERQILVLGSRWGVLTFCMKGIETRKPNSRLGLEAKVGGSWLTFKATASLPLVPEFPAITLEFWHKKKLWEQRIRVGENTKLWLSQFRTGRRTQLHKLQFIMVTKCPKRTWGVKEMWTFPIKKYVLTNALSCY